MGGSALRVRINRIFLAGTERTLDLAPGLNIITGPIATGKTTMLRLCQALVGGSLADLPAEARRGIQAIHGELVLGDETYTIIRQAVTTTTAPVEIAGRDFSARIPVYQPTPTSRETYTRWLLDALKLPRLSVPSRPTQLDSEPTPVTARDYFLYCSLRQDEIGESVFGHRDPFKNIKRRYVFQVIYGLLSLEIADLQERLRDVLSKIRELRSDRSLLDRFLRDTPWSNRAELERKLAEARRHAAELERQGTSRTAESELNEPGSQALRAQLLELGQEVGRLRAALGAEDESIRELHRLASQLQGEARRLTRAIVAGKHLTDMDFVVCPRCGSELDQQRGDEEHCYLCSQTPAAGFSREILIREQERIEAQLVEARELAELRASRLEESKKQLGDRTRRIEEISRELDYQTRAFVSARAADIERQGAARAAVTGQIEKLEEYLSVYDRMHSSQHLLEELEAERLETEGRLEAASTRSAEAERRIEVLEHNFNQILLRFHPPEFGEEDQSRIDRQTYLPLFRGRSFDTLSSPGLGTLVNVAHVLAHQKTSLEQGLLLPNILFIDGLSEHLGEEGLDPQRRNAIYEYLMEFAETFREQLQVIVVDNEVPASARSFIRMELSEGDRLIPAN